MKYKVLPAIGIARVGNSDEFFIGPETRGSLGVELDSGAAVTAFKDAAKNTRKQATRFRVFEFEDDGTQGREVTLPERAQIEWSVRLVNMKDAVERQREPPMPPMDGQRLRPVRQAGMDNRVIDSGTKTVVGTDSRGPELVGDYRGRAVKLGELRTDSAGRLIVLGGNGRTEDLGGEPQGTGGFYDHRGHYDDVSDGPVEAAVVLADGTRLKVEPAWVVVAPPDFAPAVAGLVTLLDLILDVAYSKGWRQLPTVPSFASDIQPFLMRCHSHRWVNQENGWSMLPVAGEHLENPTKTPEAIAARTAVSRRVDGFQVSLSHPDRVDTKFELRAWQKANLAKWVAGDFVTAAAPALSPAEELTYAALGSAVGYTLFPGIEVGVMMRDPSIYASPFDFRIDHAQVKPGELTALMALPWQADFEACSSLWWPAQRPNDVLLGDDSTDQWDRPLEGGQGFELDVMKFGFVVPAVDGNGQAVQREVGRADE